MYVRNTVAIGYAIESNVVTESAIIYVVQIQSYKKKYYIFNF